MEKLKVLFLSIAIFNLSANECIECHNREGLNSQKIHYRYLMLYSSNQIIERKIQTYLENPTLKNSSMPKQMLSRFGLHPKIEFTQREILDYIDKLSVVIEIK